MINFIKAVALNHKIKTTPILKFLFELPTNPDRELQVGICYNLATIFNATTEEMGQFRNLYTRWPNYSGDINHPIPSPCGVRTPANYYVFSDNLWAHNQLEQRVSLINFIINHWES